MIEPVTLCYFIDSAHIGKAILSLKLYHVKIDLARNTECQQPMS